MENKIWKIENVANQPIKFSIIKGQNYAPGILLQPKQFCLAMSKMTAPMNKQVACGYLKIDKDFNNSQNLELGIAYNLTTLDKVKDKVKSYGK